MPENHREKMRISFDLDEVLFVNPENHKVEPPPPGILRYFFKERLRLGTPKLIRRLRELHYDVWVYTSSFRTEGYIRSYFALYGVRFDGIVNGQRHLKEVQRNRSTILPQKVPTHYRITLHVDDESVICSQGRQYGYYAYQLDAQDDDWADKIIERASTLRNMQPDRFL